MKQLMNMAQYRNEVLEKQGVHVIKFFGEWCSPCKMIAPLLDELEGEMTGRVSFYKVDVDVSSDITNHYGIMSVPTVLIVKSGQVYKTLTGFQSKKNFEDAISAVL